MATQPEGEKRVLPTLNEDGSRRWIDPKLAPGRFLTGRRVVAYALIVMFCTVPFLRWGGKPMVLLDVVARQFTLFGRTFLPTDGVLLMLLLLAIFISIVWATALFGRVWCGWGCPQTVYMEFVFRPLERLLHGKSKNPSGARKAVKYLLYAVISVLLSNVFLAYFVGVERLAKWMTNSPLLHPSGFGIVMVTAGLIFFDFAYFREQMCTVICPYARLQSVLLDKDSLIIGYDVKRGEPRTKLKLADESSGDCIECGACVRTCPTGIDIREGLQLECIGCAQCIDACDTIMDKVGRDRGLIRYTSETRLESPKKARIIRPRTLIYPLLIVVFVTLLIFVGGGTRTRADVIVLRGIGMPFVVSDGEVRNQLRVKIHNRQDKQASFTISLEGAEGSQLIAPENPLVVEAGKQRTTTMFVVTKQADFTDGGRDVALKITSGSDFTTTSPYRLLGPKEPQ